MKAIILAGGRGTRLAPLTEDLPKALVPVGGRPILEWIVHRLAAQGCTAITLAVGHLAEKIAAHFGDGARFGVRIEYSHEREPLGTAGPLALVRGLDEPFLVMNGDILTTLDARDLLASHRQRNACCTIAIHPRRVPIDLGVVDYDAELRLTAYHEKPVHTYHASMGAYIFAPRALQHIPAGKRLDLPDLVRHLAAQGEAVFCHRFEGYWRDIGNHEDYEQAQADAPALAAAFRLAS